MKFLDKLEKFMIKLFSPKTWKNKKLKKIFVILFPISVPIWLISCGLILYGWLVLHGIICVVDWVKDLWS